MTTVAEPMMYVGLNPWRVHEAATRLTVLASLAMASASTLAFRAERHSAVKSGWAREICARYASSRPFSAAALGQTSLDSLQPSASAQ